MLCVALHRYYSSQNHSTCSQNQTKSISMSGVFGNVINSGKAAGKKAKIRAEIVLLDRKKTTRTKAFGIELYDELSAMTCSQDFYSTAEETISLVRPHLLGADREIRALSNKQLQAKGDLEIAVARRAEAFPEKAKNWKEKATNAATATGMLGNETKFKTKMALVQSQMNSIKEKFGLALFVELEDFFRPSGTAQLPVHSPIDKDINTIRFIFQKCKTDLEEIDRTIAAKKQDIESVDVDMSLRRL